VGQGFWSPGVGGALPTLIMYQPDVDPPEHGEETEEKEQKNLEFYLGTPVLGKDVAGVEAPLASPPPRPRAIKRRRRDSPPSPLLQMDGMVECDSDSDVDVEEEKETDEEKKTEEEKEAEKEEIKEVREALMRQMWAEVRDVTRAGREHEARERAREHEGEGEGEV
jgi:hypothetical protein